jgi:hypothetical protein
LSSRTRVAALAIEPGRSQSNRGARNRARALAIEPGPRGRVGVASRARIDALAVLVEVGALAVGALAVGALAVVALAAGALAVGARVDSALALEPRRRRRVGAAVVESTRWKSARWEREPGRWQSARA